MIVCAASCGAKGFGAFIVPCPPHWSGDLETFPEIDLWRIWGKRNVDMVNARYGEIRCNYSPNHSKISTYIIAISNSWRKSFQLLSCDLQGAIKWRSKLPGNYGEFLACQKGAQKKKWIKMESCRDTFNHLCVYMLYRCKILYDNLAAFNVFLVRCRDLTKTCDDILCELQSYLVQIMAKPLQPPFQLMASGHERALR